MQRLGVIPAAGEGSRWGGFYKELLPINHGCSLIDHTIEAMRLGRVDAVLVVTSLGKLPVLQGHLSGRHHIPIYYTVQRGTNDIYSAIEESFPLAAEWYLFAMPDTLYPVDVFDRDFHRPFGLGTFQTKRPERFGILQEDVVYNKRPQPGQQFTAWGTLVWQRQVVNLWQQWPPANYTDAINLALGQYEYDTWPMDFYHDMASIVDYRAYMRETAV